MKKTVCGTLFIGFMMVSGCGGNKKVEAIDSVTEGRDSVMSVEVEVAEQSPENDVVLSNVPVQIKDTCGLRMYYPRFSRIDLVCGKMPEKSEDSVIFVCAAAYTAGTPEEKRQGPVAGDHVSNGRRLNGYSCKSNTGAFVWYDGKGKFLYDEYSPELDIAASKGGCGFAQEMLIHNGDIMPHKRKETDRNEFRALCLIDGRIVIADSDGKQKFGDFIQNLHKAGITEALYMDMGKGWNYSWYRDEDGKPIEIHHIPSKSATNWITFYK